MSVSPHRFALFDYGFRPFFLLAALYAALAVPAWLLLMNGVVLLPTALTALQWHAHEMIFGFTLAGITGFYLTAVPNWTGAAPVRGKRLGLLVALWLVARVATWCSAALSPPLVAVADLALLPVLAVFVLPALVAAKQRRNLIFLVIPLALEIAILLVQLDALGWTDDTAWTGLQLGIDLAALLITVIGGRIVPTFTASALRARGETRLPRSAPALDRLAILSVLAVLIADLLDLPTVVGVAALAAAALNLARLDGWRTARTVDTPLLWVLHLGYGWLIVGFALKGVAGLTDVVPANAALHALTVGAIGTMMLAVMSRAALGHTGRPLAAHPVVVASYAMISLAALLRIMAPLVPSAYPALIATSGAVWTLAFVQFLIIYAPILIRPRVDGKPG
ncbi:MAG TPA: NnrS family protein [Candidatus Sulfotelmatobacter sp.]|nr:NnrS family protein [Candidatus Sulfotelmatobacter sp.]